MCLLVLGCPWFSSEFVKEPIDKAAALAALILSFNGGTRGTFSLSSPISFSILSIGFTLHFSPFRSCFLCFEVKNFLFGFLERTSSICCNWLVTRTGCGSFICLFLLPDLFLIWESIPAALTSTDTSLFFLCRDVSVPRKYAQIFNLTLF